MGLVAEYEIAFEHLPLVDVAAAVPAATLTVEVGQPNQGGPPPFVVTVASEATVGPDAATDRPADAAERAGDAPAGPVDETEAAFDASAFVAEYARIERGAGRARYQVLPAATMDEQLGRHVEEPERLRALAGNDSIVEHVTVTPDGWRQQRWFADRAAFDRYCGFWRETADSFSLLRLCRGDEVAESDPADGLTDRQRAALTTAHEMGYFEVPRAASLDDVAAELGITASSLSERLRRAQAQLVARTVAATGTDKGPHSWETGLAGSASNP